MKLARLLGIGLGFASLFLMVSVSADEAEKPRVKGKVQVQAGKGTRIQGQIVRVKAPDQVVVRTRGNKEVVFYTGKQTRYLVNGRAARFNDLRVGTNIYAVYTERDDRFYADTVTVGEVEEVQEGETTDEATEVEGTVVRVGKDQVVVKTRGGKEVIIYVSPQTKYTLDEQPARITDFQTGAPVQVQYGVQGKRFIGRSILGGRLRKN